MRIQRRSIFKTLTTMSVIAAAGLIAVPALADVPVSITQQGRILDDGEPLTGNQDLDFAIYDAASDGDLLWSDQVSADLGEDGVYTVVLGDASQPIDSELLQDGGVYLELTTNGETFSPRLEMTSVPFAALAQAANVAHSIVDGGVTADALAPGAVTSNAIDSVSWDQLVDVPSNIGESSDTLAELSCSSGQVAIHNGDWSCADLPDAANYTAGDGLNLSNNEFSVESAYFNDNYLRSDGNIDVAGNVNADGYLLADANGTAVRPALFFSGTDLSTDGDPTLYYATNSDRFNLRGAGNMDFGTTARPMDVRIFNGNFDVRGYVGINMNDDAERPLHVKSEGTNNAALVLETGGSDRNAWAMATLGSGNLRFWYSDDAGSASFSNRVTIDRSDGSYSENSDRRLKTDIEYFDGVLDRVSQLQATTYRFKDASADVRPSVGFIAQEVQEVFPELVRYDEYDDFYYLAYNDFAVLAIEAIGEQQEIIDAKAVEIETQADEINHLRSELESLDQRLSRVEAGH